MTDITSVIERLAEVKIRPVTVIHPDGVKQHMEWIIGTTKYLSNLKKIIYDTTFLQLYSGNPNKILEGCFVVDNYILKIEKWCHIDDYDKFLKILENKEIKTRGTRLYLDNDLYMGNIPFKDQDKIRNHLLEQRRDGTMWFDVLKIIDPSDNVTYFYPSKTALKNRHVDEKPKKPIPTYKKAFGDN